MRGSGVVGHVAQVGEDLPCRLGERLVVGQFRGRSGLPAVAVLSKPGYAIRYRGNEPFTQWVVYTKGEACDIVCVEPLTWTPDAPNLDAGPEVTGMRAIAPGDELVLTLALEIERV